MKNLIVGLVILGIGIVTACSNSEEPGLERAREQQSDDVQAAQKWQLVEMSGSIANVPPSTGSDMNWQEYYLLYPDSTFTKVRERDGDVREAGGTYAFVTLSDGEYLELSYPSPNDLIGSCTTEPKELLFFQSENKLTGTWQACDGPGLVYEKVEANSLEDPR